MCPKEFLISQKMEAPQFAWPVAPVAVCFHLEKSSSSNLLCSPMKFPMFYLLTSDCLPIKAGKSLGNLLKVWNDENGCSKNKTTTSYQMNPAYEIKWKSLPSAAKRLFDSGRQKFCSVPLVANLSLFSDCIISETS